VRTWIDAIAIAFGHLATWIYAIALVNRWFAPAMHERDHRKTCKSGRSTSPSPPAPPSARPQEDG
jgi:hypothetical protein